MGKVYRRWFPCTITEINPHGEGYTGYTERTLEERDKDRWSNPEDSKGLKRAIKKYGIENMQTDIIEEGLLPELIKDIEIFWIAYFDDYHNGCNWTKGGEGFDSETARESNLKRVENGTHHWLGGDIQRENARKRVENGTHPFLGGETNRKRVEKGTHPFLGGESNLKRVEKGTHNFLGENNPSHKRVADGTHNFLGKGEKCLNTRPEYSQAKWEFFLWYPLLKECKGIA